MQKEKTLMNMWDANGGKILLNQTVNHLVQRKRPIESFHQRTIMACNFRICRSERLTKALDTVFEKINTAFVLN
jgi:hypothetical protein